MSKATENEAESTKILTASEVADWLRIPKSTVYKLVQEGQIPGKKIGRHWRFDRATVQDWLNAEGGQSGESSGWQRDRGSPGTSSSAPKFLGDDHG